MKNSRTLLTYYDLTVEVETTPCEELMEHMHQTVLGQPGGLRYQHTNLEERFYSGDENYFLYLRKSGKMMGSVGFCGRPFETAGLAHDSWLIRYFSIKAPFRVVPKKRKTNADLKDEHKRSTVMGRFVQPLIADPAQLRGGEAKAEKPAIVYAIIDQTNLRSMNFSAQMGLETVGSMTGFSFSRIQPRRSDRIETVEESERAAILKQLVEYYSDYTLFYSDPVFKNNDYYVIKEGGRMVAGVQIYRVDWKFVDFGSQLANWAVKLFTRIPWVRKRIAPDQISFLAFDAIYSEPGFEKALYELMEGVLERTGHYIAMMMMDLDSGLYSLFRERKKLGILNKIMGTFFADIRVRFIHMPDEVREQFYNRPTYIPTYDNS